MPKEDVNYSNTIIYKICCKDETINDIYVGHTTNFIQRKYSHKIACNNLNNSLKIYNAIRSNGGWENWDMIEIAKYSCKDVTEARIKEQHHYNELKVCLNTNPPYVDKIKYYCFTCNIQCQSQNHYKRHIEFISHKNKENKFEKHIDNAVTTFPNNESMISNNVSMISNDFLPKTCREYCCKICDYKTCKKSSYDAHLTTTKHIKSMIFNENLPKTCREYVCQICNKKYKDYSGLWRHKKNCNIKEEINNPYPIKKFTELDKDEMIIQLLKQNAELIKGQQDMMMKLSENGINNNNHSHNTTTNSHNKAFNLNFFLNETCKNAMNITDFVDSIKLQLSDLMDIGELGYVEGISKIIVKNLNNLDETERPIHCTDNKRETMYIKNEGQWEKEDDNKTKLKKVVNKVADKNIRLLPQFREKFPDYKNASSKTSDKYEKMVIEVMTTEDNKKEKIITKISNATIINK